MNKPIDERMKEFVDYHILGDGECNAVLLRQYAKKHKLNRRQCFDLAYFFAITYCCESGIVLFQAREAIAAGRADAEKLKEDMIFQSDRRWVSIQDRFPKALLDWRDNLSQYDTAKWFESGALRSEKAIADVEQWYYFARFAAFLFIETYATVIDAPASNTTIDWKNGDTATSGLLNLFGYDGYANKFDQKHVLKLPADKLDALLLKVAKNIALSGGDANVTKIETSLCAYRKFYKGTRYNGFYLDRMLGELNWYRREKPQYNALTDELFSLRAELFPDEFLGERHGWTGVRQESKKLYMMYGII